MKMCSCGEPAEVHWSVTGEKERRQAHDLCSNCMSRIWSEINLKYKGSNALEASVFEPINQ
jgi:hypothetical protein